MAATTPHRVGAVITTTSILARTKCAAFAAAGRARQFLPQVLRQQLSAPTCVRTRIMARWALTKIIAPAVRTEATRRFQNCAGSTMTLIFPPLKCAAPAGAGTPVRHAGMLMGGRQMHTRPGRGVAVGHSIRTNQRHVQTLMMMILLPTKCAVRVEVALARPRVQRRRPV